MSRKRKNLDRYSDLNTAPAGPLPPRPLFYTETSRSYKIRSSDTAMSMTQEHQRVPISPAKRSTSRRNTCPGSPTPHKSSEDVQALTDDNLAEHNDSNTPCALSESGSTNDSPTSASGSEYEGETDEDEDIPRAARESVCLPKLSLIFDDVYRDSM